jgi:cytochrome P450
MTGVTALGPAGGIYDPLFHTPSDDLYEVYAVLREQYPVFHNTERDVWCISRFDSVLAAARDWQTFSNAHGVDLDVPARFFGEGDFLDNDPPKHDVLRALAKHRFIPRNVKQLDGLVEARVEELLDALCERDEVDLAADFVWELPIWVICRLLGIPDSDYAYVQAQMNALNTRPPGQTAAPAEVLEALEGLQGYLADCADAKRRAPGEDLLTDLIAAVDRGDLDAGDLVGIAMLMFVAGSETASTLMANGLWLLDSHRDQQRAIRDGEVPIEDAIEEIVRFESPIQYLARSTTGEIIVDDVRIPAGARVALLYGAANRDERRFPEAERFDTRREGKRHLGFGNGIHFCMGAPLARLEARIALTRFFERVADYEITGAPTRLSNHVIRGIVQLPASISVSR